MFKLLRKIEYSSISRPINLNLDDVIEVNYLEDFIIYRKDNNFKIYSRICDHALVERLYQERRKYLPNA